MRDACVYGMTINSVTNYTQVLAQSNSQAAGSAMDSAQSSSFASEFQKVSGHHHHQGSSELQDLFNAISTSGTQNPSQSEQLAGLVNPVNASTLVW